MQNQHTLFAALVLHACTRAYYENDETATVLEHCLAPDTIEEVGERFRKHFGRIRLGTPAGVATYRDLIANHMNLQLLTVFGEGAMEALVPKDTLLAVAPGDEGLQTARAALARGLAEGLALARLTFNGSGDAEEDTEAASESVSEGVEAELSHDDDESEHLDDA